MSNNEFKLNRVRDSALIELLGQRAIIMFAGTFQELARGIKVALGAEGEGILYEAGIYSGRNSIKVLLKAWKERGEAFLKKWRDFYSSPGVGWFKITDMHVDLTNGTGSIKITHAFSTIPYTLSINENQEVPNPSCHFLTGFFVGMFEQLTGKKLECEEIKCMAKDDLYCEFQLTSY